MTYKKHFVSNLLAIFILFTSVNIVGGDLTRVESEVNPIAQYQDSDKTIYITLKMTTIENKNAVTLAINEHIYQNQSEPFQNQTFSLVPHQFLSFHKTDGGGLAITKDDWTITRGEFTGYNASEQFALTKRQYLEQKELLRDHKDEKLFELTKKQIDKLLQYKNHLDNTELHKYLVKKHDSLSKKLPKKTSLYDKGNKMHWRLLEEVYTYPDGTVITEHF